MMPPSFAAAPVSGLQARGGGGGGGGRGGKRGGMGKASGRGDYMSELQLDEFELELDALFDDATLEPVRELRLHDRTSVEPCAR